LLLVFIVATLGLAGCSGSDGDTGAQGDQGPAGPPGPRAATASQLNVTIDSVTINSAPVVDFTVTDQDGLGYTGVPQSAIEATIAKLVPGTNGDTDHWQNYINETRQAVASGAPMASAIQPGRDSGGTLVDHQDGTYTYTFGTDITNVTDPIAVPYDRSLTHRVAIALRSSDLPDASNGIYTWQPSTGATDGINNRLVVETQSCDSCHNELEAHGGPRHDTRMCVTCHNPGNTDPNTGESLDFRVMVHKIHDANNLPSGGPYEVYGFGNRVVSFSDPPVVFPQDIRNCTKCHNPDNPATPQAANFEDHPSMEACGSCHDDVDFAAGKSGGHPGGVVTDNSECTLCHQENRVADSVAQSHEIPGKLWAKRFQYNILEVKDQTTDIVDKVAPGNTAAITFSVTDPTNGDAPYNIKNDTEFTQLAGHAASRLAIDLAWSTSDYTNTGSGEAPSEALSIDALASSTDNGDGTYTVTATIPNNVTGSAVVAMEGHPAGDYDGDGSYTDTVPVTSQVHYIAVTDSTPTPRRSVVDVANCQTCHGENDGLSLHGHNRTDKVQLCVICHNPRDTDLAMRPIDPDSTNNGVNDNADDKLEERSIDFKRMIHAIHGADMREQTGGDQFTVYGFGGSTHNFGDVRFPGKVQDCTTCHEDGTYEVPLPSEVLASTTDTGTTIIDDGTGSPTIADMTAALDPTDDHGISPTSSVCSTCHASTLAQAHMTANLGVFQTDTGGSAISAADSATETCAVCHGPGRIADLDVVHGMKQE